MKATEVNLNKFLSQNNTQFVIPVYQRNYDWKLTQCRQLLEDVIKAGQIDKFNGHFIGSIVYIHDDVYSSTGVTELVIIDGQQRLTTITLLYLAIYILASEMENDSLKARINETYLINKFSSEDEKLKLRPTENNDRAYKFLLRSDEYEEFDSFSRLIENFDFFKARITEDNYQTILDGLSKIMFVEISLERGKDDPQKIFESLNSTGLELSQADLIRNYILMGLSRENQNRIYQKYWEVIELNAKEEKSNTNKVSDYIRDFLTFENKKIPNKSKVYTEFKSKYPITNISQLEANLKKIKKLVFHYNRLLNPKNEMDLDIRKQLENINKLEINVAYPFLLKVYDDFANEKINKGTFIDILETVQSYAWRRFILGLPSNALNKIFMTLYQDVDSKFYLESIQRSLLKKKGSGRFPRDAELIDTLKEKDFYNIKSKNRSYFLERLENHNNKEKVIIDGNDSVTVEHIFPRNPDPKWKIALPEDEFEEFKLKYLNTIANLTLSGNNGALGNKTFQAKRDMNADGKEQGYKFSRLWLNKYISGLDHWNVQQLNLRFEKIKFRFLEVWPFPEVELEDNIDFNEMSIFDAENPTGKKLEYVIFFEQKLKITQISKLYMHVISELFELQPESFFISSVGEKIGLTKEPENLRQPLSISDIYYVENNWDSKRKFDRIKEALSLLNFEDELIIKYKQ